MAGQVITAALVVVPGPGGTVTFVRQERGPYAGWWLLPGGKMEFGEPVAAATRREAAEESGCDPGGLTLTGAYEIIGPGHHFVAGVPPVVHPLPGPGRLTREREARAAGLTRRPSLRLHLRLRLRCPAGAPLVGAGPEGGQGPAKSTDAGT